jgi:hypothetical protein
MVVKESVAMPLPRPNKGENRAKFVSRCVSILSHKDEGDSVEQRVAICHSQFKQAKADETKAALKGEMWPIEGLPKKK